MKYGILDAPYVLFGRCERLEDESDVKLLNSAN